MITGINSEDRLVQRTVADFLHDELGRESVFAWNEETFGPQGTFGRESPRDVVLPHDLRHMLALLNPGLPSPALEEAYRLLTRDDPSRSMLQMNRELQGFVRDGVPVSRRVVTWIPRDSAWPASRCSCCCPSARWSSSVTWRIVR